MSIVAKVIAQSDEANRFLSSAELTKLQSFFDNGITRISAARKLEANQQKIVDEGSKRFGRNAPIRRVTEAFQRKLPSAKEIRAGIFAW